MFQVILLLNINPYAPYTYHVCICSVLAGLTKLKNICCVLSVHTNLWRILAAHIKGLLSYPSCRSHYGDNHISNLLAAYLNNINSECQHWTKRDRLLFLLLLVVAWLWLISDEVSEIQLIEFLVLQYGKCTWLYKTV